MMRKNVFTYEPRPTAIAARKANCSPMPPPTDRLSPLHERSGDLPDLPAACLMHLERQGHPHHHPPRLAGCARANRCPSANPLGQGHLQAPQGDGRTLLRRCQAAARPPLCPLPKSRARRLPVPARRRRPEHQEDRSRPGSQAHHGLSDPGTPSTNQSKTKPRRKSTGFVSGRSRPEAASRFHRVKPFRQISISVAMLERTPLLLNPASWIEPHFSVGIGTLRTNQKTVRRRPHAQKPLGVNPTAFRYVLWRGG